MGSTDQVSSASARQNAESMTSPAFTRRTACCRLCRATTQEVSAWGKETAPFTTDLVTLSSTATAGLTAATSAVDPE